MKVKCYGVFKEGQEIFSEYANLSQKSFLSFQLASTAKKVKSSAKIESDQTSNGTWYYKNSQKTKSLHLVLLQGSSLTNANTMLSKGIEYQASNIAEERMRMKIAEQIKIINANTKMDNINSNVMELENIMKGNVNKIMNNMGDLQSTAQKSQRLSNLSMQLENDSRALEEKMKKKACMRKLIIGGVAGAFLVFLVYYFFL